MSLRRVGDFLREPTPPCDLERALRMYRRAVAAYEACGLIAEARELAYSVLRIKLRRGRELRLPLHLRVELFVFWAVAGFGWRPFRVIAAGVVTVLVYGLIYWLLGGAVRPDSAQPADLWNSVYFSGITFLTIGYGELVPIEAVPRALSVVEGIFGITVIGMLIASATKKIMNR